jgi:hypothetical protein
LTPGGKNASPIKDDLLANVAQPYVDICLDSEPQGAEIYVAGIACDSFLYGIGIEHYPWLPLDQHPAAPKTYTVLRNSPDQRSLNWRYKARKKGYYDSEIVTLKELLQEGKHTFILKKKGEEKKAEKK